MAILSRHWGSFAGVLAMSGRQVQPFVPFRRTGISAPSLAGKSRIVASLEIARGAALIAFWIFHAFERAGFVPTFISVFFVVVVVFVSCFISCASASVEKKSTDRPMKRRVPIRLMKILLFVRPQREGAAMNE